MLSRINSGTTRMGQGFKYGAQQGGILDNQLKAIGTTARYALAGQFVFGVTAAISKLSQFQVSLGNIQTVATQIGGVQGVKGINQLGDALVRVSNDTITPVQTLTDVVTNLYSSLSQNVDTSTIEKVTGIIARTARTTQVTNPTSLVGTLLGGASAYGLPTDSKNLPASVTKLAGIFYKTIQQSRNISGEEYGTYAGNLYKAAGLAGLTPQQTGALVVQSSQFGGSASSIVQNLSQLVTYLRNPKSPANKRAYAQAGITTQDLQTMTGFQILTKIIAHARGLGIGVSKAGKSLNADDIANLDPSATLGSTGVSGKGAQFITQAFGRIQSQRTLAVLANESIPELQKQVDSFAGSVTANNHAFQLFKDQAPLAATAQALSNFNLSITRDIQPLLNPLARSIGASTRAITTHDTTRNAVEVALGAVLATRLAGKLSPSLGAKLKGIKGIGRILGGKLTAGGAAGRAIESEEAAGVLAGGAVDGTRANPFWVIISPWSWEFANQGAGGLGSGPGGSAKTTAEKDAVKTAEGDVKKGAELGIGARIATLAAGSGPLAIPAAAALGLGFGIYKDHGYGTLKGAPSKWHKAAKLGFSNPDVLRMMESVPADDRTPLINAIEAAGITRSNLKKIELAGEANGTFIVKLVDANGRVISVQEEKGVPVKLWTKASFPTSQGKPGTRKGHGT